MPHSNNEIPKGDTPNETESPFYCVLEDDNLVTALSVTTDRLLEPEGSNSVVEMIIKVTTTAHRPRHNVLL